MRNLRLSRLLLGVAVGLSVALSSLMVAQPNGNFSALASPHPQNTPRIERKRIQPDLPGTLRGASNPARIPETIAFELLMRSISAHPSERIFNNSGLTETEIRDLLQYAALFESTLISLDQEVREIKNSGTRVDRLPAMQRAKDQFVDQTLNQLPKGIGKEGAGKLRSYINARVKPGIKKLPSRISRTASKDQGVYVYCNAWHDGASVYGTGTLLSDYADYSKYLITTTVVAPRGRRSSSSQAGWNYAAITDTNSLSIIPNDGTFRVESVFEGPNGYAGSAMALEIVEPLVRIEAAVSDPTSVLVPSTGAVSTLRIIAQVSFSEHVPKSTVATIELNQAANLNLVIHSVGVPTGDVITTASNRTVKVVKGTNPRTIIWPIKVTSAGNGQFSPIYVVSDVRIADVKPATVAIGTDIVPVSFTLASSSSPTPTPPR